MVGLGVFVFFPLALYLLLGLIFLVIGFMALVKICQQLRDAAKSRKLGRLIACIAVYSVEYLQSHWGGASDSSESQTLLVARRTVCGNNHAWKCLAGMPQFLNPTNCFFQIFNAVSQVHVVLQFSKFPCSALPAINKTRMLVG